MIYSFENDYSEGAHPRILKRLEEENRKQRPGYGADEICFRAADKIRQEAGCPEAAVHFFTGGTQTNLTAIQSALRPYQAVIAAETGHINVHETGAVEATGHKVIAVPSGDGKLTCDGIRKAAKEHGDEHMVQPKMVYLSDSAETGAIYRRQELEEISRLCRSLGLYLFLDGARLGSALTCPENDLKMRDLAELCDLFYIGGTKNGALFGEALVILRPELQKDFRYSMKQRGGMLAKGWLLGLQFDELFTGGLYWELAERANRMAEKLREGLAEMGISFRYDSPTNQLFPVFTERQAETLGRDFRMTPMGRTEDGRQVTRLVASWATEEWGVDAFLGAVRKTIG